MRTAIVSDIHGNLTAFDAVLADLSRMSPDLILHGGDLAGPGSRPAEIVDRIRDLGWRGVIGNTDEMLHKPETLVKFAASAPQFKSMFDAIEEMAERTREVLGPDRVAWLGALVRVENQGSLALVHATPASTWRAPQAEAADAELERVYTPLGKPVVVYGHLHWPFVRQIGALTVANSGTVGSSYDGDPRASYLLLDDYRPQIRRVEYDIEAEIRALIASGLPHAEWVARSLRSSRPEMR